MDCTVFQERNVSVSKTSMNKISHADNARNTLQGSIDEALVKSFIACM